MIKVVFDRENKPLSLDLTNVPTGNVRATNADAIIRDLAEQLGRSIGIVKVQGYWVLGDTTDGAWRPIYGHQPGQQTRSFEKVLREGLQITTVRTVPL